MKNIYRIIRVVCLGGLLGWITACGGKQSAATEEVKEDLVAKAMLQGIWLDEETDEPLMWIKGDTILYADDGTKPLYFRIVKDSLFSYGQDTVAYRIDRQTEHVFWFHWMSDKMIKVYKSAEGSDSLYFQKQEAPIPIYTEVVKRDTVVVYEGVRYHSYEYVNPSTYKVTHTTYSEEGIAMEHVYFDNIMHVRLYEGKKQLFGSDISKQMFAEVLTKEQLDKTIFADLKLYKVDRNGFHYQALFSIPESSIYLRAYLQVAFDGTSEIVPEK